MKGVQVGSHQNQKDLFGVYWQNPLVSVGRTRRKINSAGTKYAKPVWCTTYNTRGKQYCASMQIQENILWKLPMFSDLPNTINGLWIKILEIRVPENGTLIFIFKTK